MSLDSLPPRPLTVPEGRTLHRSDTFRMAAPASASSKRGRDTRLVSALVLVTGDTVYGVGYDVEQEGWQTVFRETYGTVGEADDLAAEANDDLREWVGHREESFGEVEEGIEATEEESERARLLFDQYDDIADGEES
ncbi:hypothetical protein [Salarchaeum japonicum]|uniref:hypothetical protein n=1 Tax=Salarchaeum japonicum TaxID=555573 RepID=UPI003C791CBC